MRGNLSPSVDISNEYSAMMPVLTDFHAKVPCTVVPTESACGAVTSSHLMGATSPEQRSMDAGHARERTQELNERTVLAPPMFIFQKMAPSMKRRAERWEEGAVVGVSPSKRVRSFTLPSPRTRSGSCDSSRRIRSSSLSFPPARPVSRSNVFMTSNICNRTNVSTETVSAVGRVRRSLLRPALLLAPQPCNISGQPHLPEVRDDLSSITTNCLSSASESPQVHRSKTNVPISDRVQFVFGENMSERVLSPQKTTSGEYESDCSSSDSESSSSDHKEAVWSTLRESAAAYTASCGRHRLLRCVQLFTGEEKESNVVQLTCRLFVLEKGTQSWSERGRGVLRLNDLASGTKGGLQSRIVMRHQGSLKVILNTKLWPQTHLRRPGRRNIQVTATDMESQSMRVFLIQASARDVARLYVAIYHRLVALRCSPAGLDTEAGGGRAREGHCNSENEEEEEEEEERQRQEREEGLTRLRPVVCDWMHSKPSLGSW